MSADSAVGETVQAPQTPLTFREVWRIAPMRRLWYAQIVSNFGDFLALYAVLSVVSFRMHATPTQVTWVQISYLMPIAILGILAGVFVDRWPVKPTLVMSDLIRACLTLLLLAATQLWHFYAVLALISVVSSFFGPAQSVTIQTAVPRAGLTVANSLMQQAMFLVRIAAPAAAGLLVASFGPVSCYLADAASFAASAALISSIAIARPTKAATHESTHTGLHRIWFDLKQGLSFIAHHAALSFVILAFAAGMFTVGCFGPLIAIYVREDLRSSTRVFGFASSLIGVGILVGSFAVRSLAKKLSSNAQVQGGLGGIGVGLVLLATMPVLPATLLACFTIGLSVAAIFIPAQVLIQQETPRELMGRVGSTVMSVVFAAQVSGLLLSGVLAQLTSVRAVFAMCAAFLAVLIAAGTLLMRHRSRA